MEKPMSNDNGMFDFLPSDPEDLKEVWSVIKSISDSRAIMRGHQEQIREDRKAICKKHKIPMKYFNKVANIYHKQSFEQFTEENEIIESSYQKLLNLNKQL